MIRVIPPPAELQRAAWQVLRRGDASPYRVQKVCGLPAGSPLIRAIRLALLDRPDLFVRLTARGVVPDVWSLTLAGRTETEFTHREPVRAVRPQLVLPTPLPPPPAAASTAPARPATALRRDLGVLDCDPDWEPTDAAIHAGWHREIADYLALHPGATREELSEALFLPLWTLKRLFGDPDATPARPTPPAPTQLRENLPRSRYQPH